MKIQQFVQVKKANTLLVVLTIVRFVFSSRSSTWVYFIKNENSSAIIKNESAMHVAYISFRSTPFCIN